MASSLPYFATEAARKLVQRIESKIEECEQALTYNGVKKNRIRNRCAYFPAMDSGTFASGLDALGTHGELVGAKDNQLRSLCRQFLSLVTKQRLDFESHAQVTDTNSLSDTRLASGLIKSTITYHNVEAKADALAELCVIDGDAYTRVTWDAGGGKVIQAMPDNPTKGVMSGTLKFEVVESRNVYQDPQATSLESNDWIIVKYKANKYSLAAQYPGLAEQILKVESCSSDYMDSNFETDLVWCYDFEHKQTPVITKGRFVTFLSADCVLFDGLNPYPFFTITQMRPEAIHGTPYSYTFLNDLVPLQELLNIATSTTSSNVSAYGLQTLLNPSGNNLSRMDVGGIAFLDYKTDAQGGGKPEPLSLPSTPAEVYKFASTLTESMMRISNINATLRGAPPPNVTSGAMAATLSANAIELVNQFSKAYNLCLEQTMWKVIQIYRFFAKFEQVISIVGANKAAAVQKFVGQDIGDVSKVTLRVRAPLLQTSAGIESVAKNLLDSGMITKKQEYLYFLETGNIETLIDDETDEAEFIEIENDSLAQGEPVSALVTDNHGGHIQSHKCILNDPALRKLAAQGDPKARAVIEAVMNHMTEHYQLMTTSDPAFLAVLATGTLPQMAPPPEGQQNG
jgi:hypothetical protein